MSFMDQFEKARKEIVALKKTTPYIFKEWQRVQAAERRLQKAKDELVAAKAQWNLLGKKDK